MRVRIFGQEQHVQAIADFRVVLATRRGPFASFWLGECCGSLLGILVNDQSACVHFFPDQTHPGFYAVGLSSDWEKLIEFITDNYETARIPVAMVVPWSAAMEAANEFFHGKGHPTSLNWLEL